jgi:hypothetical protein
MLDALVAIGVFFAGLGSLRADSVTLFIFVFMVAPPPHHAPLTPHHAPRTAHRAPRTPHPSPLTPHPSPFLIWQGAFLAMILVYSLFVAARWQPPAVRCRCITLVPSALFRLLALAACLAYVTSSTRSAASVVSDLLNEPETAQRTSLRVQRAVVLSFHLAQALLNSFAAFVIVHRLWLQSTEDDRAWLVVHEEAKPDTRCSRRHLVIPGSVAGSMV